MNRTTLPDSLLMSLARRLLPVATLTLICATPSYAQTFDVINFGATANDDSDDDQAAFSAAVAAALAMTGDVTITTGVPGTYHFKSKVNDNYVLRMNSSGASSITFDGAGSTFILQYNGVHNMDLAGFLDGDNCDNVTLKGFTIDYLDDQGRPSTSTQGRVEAIDSNGNWTEMSVAAGFAPPKTDPIEQYAFSRILDGMTLNLKPGFANRQIYDIEARGGQPPIYRLHHLVLDPGTNDSADPADGDLITLPQPDQSGPGTCGVNNVLCAQPAIRLSEIDGVSVSDVFIHSSPSFGLLITDSTDAVVDLVRVVPGPNPGLPGGPDRWFSTSRDGIHLDGIRGGTQVTNCRVKHTADDGITIHGRATGIVAPITNWFQFQFLLPANGKSRPIGGDRIRALNWDAGPTEEPFQELVVQSATGFSSNPPKIDVNLRQPATLPADVQLQILDAHSSDFLIARNNCSQVMGRGIMVRSDRGVIEENIVSYTVGPGISLLADRGSPGGSGANQVRIRGNRIYHSHLRELDADFWRGGINIYNRGERPVGSNEYLQNFDHPTLFQDVFVYDNTIQDCHGPNLVVSNASNITVSGNKFVNAGAEYPGTSGNRGIDITSIVDLEMVDGVTFSDNTLVGWAQNGPIVHSQSATDVFPSDPDDGFTVQ